MASTTGPSDPRAASPEPGPPQVDERGTRLLIWSVVLLFLAPVSGCAGAMLTIGDPGTAMGATVPFLVASVWCSVAAFVRTRHQGALAPTVVVLVAAGAVGWLAWQDAHRGNNGIPEDVVALDVSYLDGTCWVSADVVYAAGSHHVMFASSGGATLTIRGPAPSSTEVYRWTRPEESDGYGPSVVLEAGTYTLTCSDSSGSAQNTLNVLP